MNIEKYTIHHVDLSSETVLGDSLGPGAHYIVFWYRSIPLGDHYFSSSPKIGSDEFNMACLQAIWPSLAKYYADIYHKHDLVKPLTINLKVIRDACDEIVGKLHPSSVPESCAVSLVICTRDRASQLRQCLNRLFSQVCHPAEIIVVDNASATDATRQVVEQFPSVRYLREERPGLDIARNTGAKHAKFPIVAYTDDDTVPDPYWIFRVSQAFDHPSIAAMTGLVIAASLKTEAEIIFEKYWPFNRGYLAKTFDDHFFHSTLETGPPVWEIGAGANMAFRKEVFEKVGYFDERLDVGAAGCSGDSEMWYRILASGHAIKYNPQAVVHHSHRDSIEGLKKQLHGYMRGFTVAILIQYQRFGHRGNLRQLMKIFPFWYLTLLRKGFPKYEFQYKTLFSELSGILSGFFYYWKHRNADPRIF